MYAKLTFMFTICVFMFTICVVPLNGVVETNTKSAAADITILRDKMVIVWSKHYERFKPIKISDDGKLLMKIMAKPNSRRCALFVPWFDRIGVNITEPTVVGDTANEEVLNCVANVLNISKFDLNIYSGIISNMKTIEFIRKRLTIEGIIDKIITTLAEQLYYEDDSY